MLGEGKHSQERVDELVTSSLEQGPQKSSNTAHRLIYGTISARRAVPENTAFLFQRTARSAHPAGERVAFITENGRLTVRQERVFSHLPFSNFLLTLKKGSFMAKTGISAVQRVISTGRRPRRNRECLHSIREVISDIFMSTGVT